MPVLMHIASEAIPKAKCISCRAQIKSMQPCMHVYTMCFSNSLVLVFHENPLMSLNVVTPLATKRNIEGPLNTVDACVWYKVGTHICIWDQLKQLMLCIVNCVATNINI